MGCHALLQGVFPTQGLNLCLPLGRRVLYPCATGEALCFFKGCGMPTLVLRGLASIWGSALPWLVLLAPALRLVISCIFNWGYELVSYLPSWICGITRSFGWVCKPPKRFYLSFFQVPSTQDLWKLQFPVLEFLDGPDGSNSFLKPIEGRPWLYAFRGLSPISRVRVKADEFLCHVFAGTEPFESIFMLRVVYICKKSYFQLPNLHGPKALSLYSICLVRFSC